MSDLFERIRRAQVEAGERVVMESLKAKGFDGRVLQEIVGVTYFTPQECNSLCAHCGKVLSLHTAILRCQ